MLLECIMWMPWTVQFVSPLYTDEIYYNEKLIIKLINNYECSK